MIKKLKTIMIALFIIAVPSPALAADSTQLIYTGDASYNAVALTFDDCNDPENTQAILDILQKNKIRATFFTVGEAVEANPQLFRNMAAAGHQIANHTYSHPHLSQLSYAGIQDELNRADAAIVQVTGKSTKPYFRTPYYDYNSTVWQSAGDAGYSKGIMCTINTEDWSGIPASQITSMAVNNASPGAIIAMHAAQGGSNTVEALQDMITGLKNKGYSFATVDDILKPAAHTVTFNSQGGNGVDAIGAGYCSAISAPEQPQKTEYAFLGWYIEPECINKWDFEADKVTSDMTLYAKWKWTGKIKKLAGADRYEMAVELSKTAYYAADTAVLATGLNFPDALVAGPLAVNEDAPLLLTKADSMPQSTMDELIRLHVKKVIIMGDEGVVSALQAETLTDMGIEVTRVSGADRYATSVEAAKLFWARSGVADRIVLSTGQNLPNALCTGSFAAKEGIPILLTETGRLPAVTKSAIAESGIKQVVIPGGTGFVSQSVEDELAAMGITVIRSSGEADIAGSYFPPSSNSIVITGIDYPEALAAVPLAAKADDPVLIVIRHSLNSKISLFMPNSQISNITIAGDDKAVKMMVK